MARFYLVSSLFLFFMPVLVLCWVVAAILDRIISKKESLIHFHEIKINRFNISKYIHLHGKSKNYLRQSIQMDSN